MRRTARKRDLPHLPPVEKIELTGNNKGRRLIAAAFFLAVGAVAIAYGFFTLIAGDGGWREIEASDRELNCSSEYVFLYNVGASGLAASVENRSITALYTEASQKAYRLFTIDEEYEGISNVASINSHPGEVLTLDPVLYDAFSLMAEYGRREIYLAPVYSSYDDIFLAVDDVYAAQLDPSLNQELAAYYRQVAAFARDPSSVDLQLLGDNRVKLYVSEEYLRFAQENEISAFIDFFWMKNAFITDFLAETMLSKGYTLGAISSYDGFSRSLTPEGAGGLYSLNIFDRVGQTVYPAAVMEYSAPTAIVCLRNYPANTLDELRYYVYASGETRSAFLDLADGQCRTAINDLSAYSESLGCAEVLMRLIPVYITDQLDVQALKDLHSAGIEAIWCENSVIRHTDPSLQLSSLYEGETVFYRAERSQ